MKNIVILGSTGSIGKKTLEVVRDFPQEFKIIGLSCNSNIGILEEQIKEFQPRLAVVSNEERYRELKQRVKGCKISTGKEGLIELATFKEADFIVFSMSGIKALIPLLKAIENEKQIGLANKELLVAAGKIVIQRAKQKRVKILPIDSEQSAIFQCLEGRNKQEIKRIFLTASGGPLNNLTKEDLWSVSPQSVLKHPKWKMGEKITVDSATLMNKGLELIEAKYFFDVEIERIEILIHPEVLIHSMVEFIDGSIIAQLGIIDMRLPIQYALSCPQRLPFGESLNFSQIPPLSFKSPDEKKFPSLRLVREAEREGGTTLTVLNAADEVAVRAFLDGQIKFTDISGIVEKVIEKHRPLDDSDINNILQADEWARKEARKIIKMTN
ncbi:MAG: 1-deoxy-D-xylulose-5-phosphate reductoisomerase [Candidatus Omnitrophica bacterium 4484_213]|nr:MAG: 1-deoxy-D-xylulose-5-phosphate reductoisomerase [Candidatus Omnitrophica bacterium 4484_213]